MGVRILEDKDTQYKVLYCSTTMKAFGPIFYEHDDVDTFLKWLGVDPRKFDESELLDKFWQWKKGAE